MDLTEKQCHVDLMLGISDESSFSETVVIVYSKGHIDTVCNSIKTQVWHIYNCSFMVQNIHLHSL